MGCILNTRERKIRGSAGGDGGNENGLHRGKGGILMMDLSQSLDADNNSRPLNRLPFLLAALLRARRVIQSVKIEALDETPAVNKRAEETLRRKGPFGSFRAASQSRTTHSQPGTPPAPEETSPSVSPDFTAKNKPTQATRKRKLLHSPLSFKMSATEKSKGFVKSKSAHTISGNSRASRDEGHQPNGDPLDDVILFTNIPQLCYEVVNKTLLRRMQPSANGRVLCLFLFGCRGSSKGELAFKLVDHSAMAKSLATGQLATGDCPLYHHMDVAAIVAANIDVRIREFNQLVTQTARNSNRHGAFLSSGEDLDSASDNLEAGRLSPGSETLYLELREPSISSQSGQSATSSGFEGEQEGSHQPVDDFDLITPNTKQRSVLQLKLMKYSNSITPKWVFGLIERQLDNLEEQLMKKFLHRSTPERLPDRVYLINMVPNHLSLFKSCLYLKQDVFLKNFKYHYQALKFERCTNIKLLTKERAVAQESENSREGFSVTRTLGITHLHLSLMGATDSRSSCDNSGAKSSKDDQDHSDLTAVATSALADSVNEKLGPKLNDTFAQQFKNLNRLVQVRYNQTHDYNYTMNLGGHESSWRADRESQHRVSCSRYLQKDEEPRCWSSCERTPNQLNPGSRQLSSSMQELQLKSEGSPRLSLSTFNAEQASPSLNLLSPSQAPSQASSNSSIATNVTSGESDLLVGAPESTKQHRASSARFSPIPSAVELELFDSGKQSDETTAASKFDAARHRWRGSSVSASSQNSDQLGGSRALRLPEGSGSSCSLDPKSRAPLIFAGHQQRGSSTYQLLPKRIIYANEQTQVILEVRRLHPRSLKLKTVSDLARLHKMVTKASSQLEADCENWLFEDIGKKHGSIEDRRRLYSLAGSHDQPPLVVFTIRVDVRRLKSGHFQYPANFDATQATSPPEPAEVKLPAAPKQLEPVSILKINETSDERSEKGRGRRALSAQGNLCSQRPGSNATRSSHLAHERQDRRVHFLLCQTPNLHHNSRAGSHNELAALRAQRRQWIHSGLFVSADQSGGRLMDLVAALMRLPVDPAAG